VKYILNTAGNYQLLLNIRGKEVPGSPFPLQVQPGMVSLSQSHLSPNNLLSRVSNVVVFVVISGPIEPSNCVAYGEGVIRHIAGQQRKSKFFVCGRDAYGNIVRFDNSEGLEVPYATTGTQHSYTLPFPPPSPPIRRFTYNRAHVLSDNLWRI